MFGKITKISNKLQGVENVLLVNVSLLFATAQLFFEKPE